MRYFMYSPLDMSEQEAFSLAKHELQYNRIVYIRRTHPSAFLSILPGERPQAYPNTYLVRVEPDDSLRIVDRNLD